MNIKRRLVSIFLLISLVPAAILGTVGYVNTESQLTREALKNLDALASVQENAIQGVVQDNFERLASFTSRLQLKIELDKYNTNGSEESLNFINSLLAGIKSQISSFKEISVLDAEGRVVASTDQAEVGADRSNEEFFIKGKDQNDVTIFFKDRDQNPRVYLTGPLVLDGKLIGVAAIISDVENLYSITGHYATLSQTGESFVAKRDQNGDALLITPLRFDPDAALNTRISKDSADSPIIQALLGDEETFTNTVDYREKPVLAATRYIENADLGLVVKIDRAEAFAPLDDLRNLALITGAIGTALVTATSFFLGDSISSPITRLRDKVTEISKGNFDVKIEGVVADRKDEIGELAIHFDEMRQSVKGMKENLQSLVHEKTEELESANAELKETVSSLRLVNERLEKQEKQLLRLDVEKEEFSAMMAHELKTPLTPIDGYLDLLQRGRLGELTEQQKQVVKIMYDNSQRLLRLIQDMLDIRKIEVGKLKLNVAEVSSRYVVEQCINAFQTTSIIKSITLVDGVQDATFTCDAGRIIQVLNNLVSNSIKFVSAGGKIEINAASDNGSVTFSVKDNGIGIPKEKQKDLFTKFYQVDTSLSRKSGGSGLGLAICKGIVEAHGGKIWIESEEKVGTTVYFSIPRGGQA